MNTKKTSLLNIGILLTVTAVIGKLLGFLRGVLISYNYGATALTDAFFLAITIPTTLLGVFTYSADSAVIPQYRRLSLDSGRQAADKNFSNIINILAIISIMVSVLILAFPSAIVTLFAPNFSAEQSNYAIVFLKLFCASGFMHIITCFFSAYCTVYQRVRMRAMLAFTTNLIVVLSLVIWADPKMYFLAIIYVLGSVSAAVAQCIVALRIGYKHSFSIDFKQPELKKFVVLFLPIMGSALLNDIRLLIGKVLASGLEVGSLSYLDYANKFTALFDSMIVVGIGVVLLPLFASYSETKEWIKFSETASRVTLITLLVLLPITIVVMVFSRDIVQLVYGRGSFGQIAVNKVAQVLLFSSPIITFSPLNMVLSRAFYAKEDTRTPLIASSISIGLNMLLSIILSKSFGLVGIPLSASITALINSVILIIALIKTVGWSNETFGVSHLWRLCVCCGICTAIGIFSMYFNIIPIARLLLGTLMSSIAYLSVTLLLFRKEVKFIIGITKLNRKK